MSSAKILGGGGGGMCITRRSKPIFWGEGGGGQINPKDPVSPYEEVACII